MDQNKLTPVKTFGAGIAMGILVLCTIGFFIMIGVYLKGKPSGETQGSADNNDTIAEDAGDYPEQFSKCLDSGKYADEVKAQAQEGTALGVNGTPATFINGYMLTGAMPVDVVKDVIGDLLAGNAPFIDNFQQFGLNSGALQKLTMPDLGDAVWRGGDNAKVFLVEYSDFECPYCARFLPTIQQVLSEYGDKIRFTFRNFPLYSIHPNAAKAAEAFECAKEQGKAYEMHDKLFGLSTAGQLKITSYKQAAKDLGLK